MSDKVGILLNGRLEQYDTARTVYFSPATYAAAGFLGPVNTLNTDLVPLLEWEGTPPRSTVFARSEGLEILPAVDGVWEVEEIRFVGILILYTIKDTTKNGTARLKVYCIGDGLEPGDRVRCRVTRFFTDS